VLLYQGTRKELTGGFRRTTNNRMEIVAAIVALHALKCPCEVTLYTDSRYLVDSIMKGGARRWREHGWMRNRKEKARNGDLWEQLLDLCARHRVTFEWVRGHAGNPENERCDCLSVGAAQGADLAADECYENEPPEGEETTTTGVATQPTLFGEQAAV
jgi:ribonuclease HI